MRIIIKTVKKEMRKRMDETEARAELAINIGAGLLESGAEVSRAEESVMRISTALGAKKCDVFVIISFILLTYEDDYGRSVTKSRRIHSGDTDYGRFERLNALSREICEKKMSLTEAKNKYEKSLISRNENKAVGYLQSMTVAICFALYFGGGIREAIASAVSANTVQFMMTNVKSKVENRVLFVCLTCFVAGLCSFLLVKAGVANDYDTVAIGNIMLMVPGLSLVSAARDIIVGDLLCGILRFFETVLTALAIAVGFALPLLLI